MDRTDCLQSQVPSAGEFCTDLLKEGSYNLATSDSRETQEAHMYSTLPMPHNPSGARFVPENQEAEAQRLGAVSLADAAVAFQVP